MILGGLTVWLNSRRQHHAVPSGDIVVSDSTLTDTVAAATAVNVQPAIGVDTLPLADTASVRVTSEVEKPVARIETTRFPEVAPSSMAASPDNPFRKEAAKVLSGRLEETDSLNRHKILSYCEHLRSSYTTRDIDFIRQVFSDNALIIVGQVVKTGDTSGMNYSDRVRYSIRSKQAYIENLARIFDSGKDIDVRFSDFRIMRHPTMEGIYGVTLRQKYSCGSYSDDGYLFLLWDFRDRSMPLIHVRTWQPSVSLGDDDVIDIGDFNLE